MTLCVDAPEFTPLSFSAADDPSEASSPISDNLDSLYGAEERIKYTPAFLFSRRTAATKLPPSGHEWLQACGLDLLEEPAPKIMLIPLSQARRQAKDPKTKAKSSATSVGFEKLHKSQNRWRTKSSSNDDRAAKSVTALLNKLSTANMAKLVEQFVTIVLQASIVRRAAELFFEKAVSEPGFAYVYSKFAVGLFGAFARRSAESQAETDSFEGVLFENLAANEPELFVEFDRKRANGTARFIGELYNVGIAPASAIHERVFGMLSMIDQQHPEEHHVELLCKFVQAIGKMLEAVEPDAVERYFNVLSMIEANPAMSPRARFMIMDLVDLRTNGWAAGHAKQPMKLPSIENEAAQTKVKLSAEQVDKRTTSLLAELLSSRDVADAVTSLAELDATEKMAGAVFKAITLGLDRKQADREIVVGMLTRAGEEGVIPSSQLEGGFTNVLELIEDLEIDIPHASQMVTTMLGGVVAKGFLPLSFLDKALPFFPPNEQPAVHIIEVLSAVHAAAGEAMVKQIYQNSAEQWSIRKYLKEEDITAAPLLSLILQ